jgi:hypothetical protein
MSERDIVAMVNGYSLQVCLSIAIEEVFKGLAANVNNKGAEEQVMFLKEICGWSTERIAKLLVPSE